MDDHRAGGLRSFDCEELPRHNRPLADFNERIIRGARLSRGLSAKQIEILQVLASHWHGEGTVTHLASIYAVRSVSVSGRTRC